MSNQEKSVKYWLIHMASIYAVRNKIEFQLAQHRTSFIVLSARELWNRYRKEVPKDILEQKLATVFGAWCACVNLYDAEGEYKSFIEILSRKYPSYGCGYCAHKPCECAHTAKRPAHQCQTSDEEQINWSLKEWQSHFDCVYGSSNRQLGLQNVLLRLVWEVEEVVEITLDMYVPVEIYNDVEGIRREILKELTDVFAWICALACVLDIDLEYAVQKHYGAGCPVCEKTPCSCPRKTRCWGFLGSVAATRC